MLKDIINTYENLKKNIYLIDRGNENPIIIKFKDKHFYHLLGLHKLNLDMFFPPHMKLKDKRYKHIKKNITKYENIILNQIKNKKSLEIRIQTFYRIIELLEESGTYLYDLSHKTKETLYRGDFGLFKFFDNKVYCLLGLKEDDSIKHLYAPQSWMADTRRSFLVDTIPKYYKSIAVISSKTAELMEL